MTQHVITADTRVRRVDGLVFARLGEELLALDAERDSVYCLNESAGEVWDLLAQPTTVSAVGDQLMSRYEVDEATSYREILAVVQGLFDAGLVETTSDPTPAGA